MIATSTIPIVSPPSASDTRSVVEELGALSLRALRRMYLPEKNLFAFRLRRSAGQDVLEGISPRYTAIALLGLLAVDEESAQGVLGGRGLECPAAVLLDRLPHETNLGNVALTLWVARTMGDARAKAALDRLRQLDPVGGSHPTVEVAWALTALSIEPDACGSDERLARSIADRLRSCFHERTGFFSRWPNSAVRLGLRAHIACFADVVYPIQALCHFHMWSGCPTARSLARRCGERMMELQGSAGQWWWHFDVRTGNVVERYPVYAVHQDAMAPMALFALEDSVQCSVWSAADKGMGWLCYAPEIGRSLIDRDAGLIWRKVARREPRKLSRRLQAIASRLDRRLRMPGVDVLFPPTSVDYECRPYHLGWLLYAWSNRWK